MVDCCLLVDVSVFGVCCLLFFCELFDVVCCLLAVCVVLLVV